MNGRGEPLAMTPEEASEFYRVLGRALWALGAFEYHLVHYLVIVLRSSFDTMETAENELDRAFGFTLGRLVHEFRKYRDLTPDFDRRLDAFVTERNWLCHRIYRQNNMDLLNRDRFFTLVRRLAAFKMEASALHQVLEAGLDRWAAANGISQEELETETARTLEKWKE